MADNPVDKPKTPSFGDIMKEAQKIQQKMKWAQAELASNTAVGTAGGFTISIDGRYQVKSAVIDDAAWSEGKERLQDLIVVATNDALQQVAKFYQEQMTKLTKDMGMPPEAGE